MTTESPTKETNTSPNRRLNALLERAKRELNETRQPRTTSASSAPMYASTGRKLEELECEIIKEQYKLIDAQEKCIEKQRAKIDTQKAIIEDLRKQIEDSGQ